MSFNIHGSIKRGRLDIAIDNKIRLAPVENKTRVIIPRLS